MIEKVVNLHSNGYWLWPYEVDDLTDDCLVSLKNEKGILF